MQSSQTVRLLPAAMNVSGRSPRSSRLPHMSQETSGWWVMIARVAIGQSE